MSNPVFPYPFCHLYNWVYLASLPRQNVLLPAPASFITWSTCFTAAWNCGWIGRTHSVYFCSSQCIPAIFFLLGFLCVGCFFLSKLDYWYENYHFLSLLTKKKRSHFASFHLSEFLPLMSGKFHLRSFFPESRFFLKLIHGNLRIYVLISLEEFVAIHSELNILEQLGVIYWISFLQKIIKDDSIKFSSLA